MKKPNIYLLALITLLALTQASFATPGPPPSVPDSGSASLMLGVALGGMVWAKKFFRR